mmetsp:Transcript_11105/g.30678  ORF Transcript_11105/g.30678 Transcript_11105/m.30678 type:complete len:273 (-) Transcript_11105:246-1064(-)
MGLPRELLPYAENFFRRFPEEFIALGAPGLEDAFDLRPNSTWTRKILETPIEKTVEVTIRRWQTPYACPPGQLPHPWMPQVMYPGHYGGCPTSAHVSVPSEEAKRADEQATARLVRLESALATLKPQIEAVLTAQTQANAQLHQRAISPESKAQLTAPSRPGRPDSTVPGTQAEDGTESAPTTSFTESRRLKVHQLGLAQLQIQPIRHDAGHHPSVVKLDAEGKPLVDTSKLVDGSAKNDRKPVIQVNTARLSVTGNDPASPRSPGRFSAWN